MARDFHVNGETMVYVKGRNGSDITNLQELGLAADQIRISLDFRHRDIQVDAWGELPPEVQAFLAGVNISMNLVHFDRSILECCMHESIAGRIGSSFGTLGRAGARLGGGAVRFSATNRLIGLNLTSVVDGAPWRFLHTFMTQNPVEYPLGTEKSVVAVRFRCIPYTVDPWNGGAGASGTVLFDRNLDT